VKIEFIHNVDDWEYLILIDGISLRIDGNDVVLVPVSDDDMMDEDGNLPDETYYFLAVKELKDNMIFTTIIGWNSKTLDDWHDLFVSMPTILKSKRKILL